MAKKAIYKVFNGNSFEDIYFKTSIEQVDGLQDALSNIPDASNFVQRTGAQTIAGIKTFNDGIVIPGSNKYIDLGNKNNWFWTRFSGENWSFNNNYTGGGWARNLMEMKDAEGNAYLRIGAQGNSQTFSQMYIGPAYNNYWLSLNNTRALFGTKPQYAGDPTANNDLTRKLYVDTELSGKAPTSHTHLIGNVSGLQTALNDKAPLSHGHTIANVSGLQTALDGKAASSHTHLIGHISGLQTALNDKAEVGAAPTAHTHLIGNISGLQTVLNGKAASSHSHEINDVSGLSAELSGKAPTSHNHLIGQVSGLQTALNDKATLTHSHAISNVSGLQTALNGKAATGQVVLATTENKNILGTSQSVFNISEKKVWFNKGALFYGTALDAGLVTRGISGTNSTGSAKDHLYINYDGNNTLSRQLVLGAGSVGTSRGNGIYDYSAVRGDAFIAYLTNTLGSYAKTSDLTKGNVGLSNVQNYLTASKTQAEAGTSDSYYMTPLRVKQAITANAAQIPTNVIRQVSFSGGTMTIEVI